MPNSVYKIIELVGSSPESWEKAAQNAVDMASKTFESFASPRSSSRICRLRAVRF